jgi:hypothetical protein
MRWTRATIVILMLAAALCLPTAAQEASPPASPIAELMNSFHTIYAETGTWLSKPEMLSGALMKHPEFDYWGMSVVRRTDADARLRIDHQPGWFYYTYSLTHQATGTVLASGKVTAWDGKVACDKIADELIKRIKKFRPGPAKKKE